LERSKLEVHNGRMDKKTFGYLCKEELKFNIK